ncbi:hypothetical protein ACRRTK_022298 [Alexandromys fortis]
MASLRLSSGRRRPEGFYEPLFIFGAPRGSLRGFSACPCPASGPANTTVKHSLLVSMTPGKTEGRAPRRWCPRGQRSPTAIITIPHSRGVLCSFRPPLTASICAAPREGTGIRGPREREHGSECQAYTNPAQAKKFIPFPGAVHSCGESPTP